MGRCGLDSSGSRWGPVFGFCRHGNKPSGSIKNMDFLKRSFGYWLLTKYSVLWT
jgi:hypothetical protein